MEVKWNSPLTNGLPVAWAPAASLSMVNNKIKNIAPSSNYDVCTMSNG